MKAGLKNVSEEFQCCKDDWKRCNALNIKKIHAKIENLIIAEKTLETLRREYNILLNEHKITKYSVVPNLEKKLEDFCKEIKSLKKELKCIKDQCGRTFQYKIQTQFILEENTRLFKENKDYSNTISNLQEKIVDLNNVLVQYEVKNTFLKANAQILFKALLKIQNNIESFKNDFCHFS